MTKEARRATVLLVDNNKDIRKRIATALKGAGFDVTEARKEDEAKRKLDQAQFDIVASDMFMSRPSGGLEVAQFIRPLRSPYHSGLDTIVIVYTFRPSYPDCVLVIRAGGYDYIAFDKNEKLDDEISRLIQSCKRGLREKKEWAGDPDAEYVRANVTTLLKKYAGHWIAVRGQEVIVSAENLTKLYQDLREKFPYARPYIIQMGAEPSHDFEEAAK